MTPRPSSGLGEIARRFGTGAPYWAYVWPGGSALAQYLHEHPELVRGRSVLDFGSGCGVVAIAAAQAGAKRVVAVDPDPLARRLTELNAAHNGIAVETLARDVTAGEVEIVLAGDVFYSPVIARRSQKRLAQHFSRGAVIRIGDPGRPDLPATYRAIACYLVAEVGSSARQTALVYEPT